MFSKITCITCKRAPDTSKGQADVFFQIGPKTFICSDCSQKTSDADMVILMRNANK